MSKRVLLLYIFCLCVSSVQGQDRWSASDSLNCHITAILQKYNESAVIIDTSMYSNEYPDALNSNLWIASSKGYCGEILRLLTKGADINSSNNELATSLHYAVQSGRLDVTEILLLCGSSTQSMDIYGRTPLKIAIEDRNVDMADLLIRYGASFDTTNSQGVAPVHVSVINNDFYMTDMFIYHKANLDIRDKEGNTPLMLAVWNTNYEIADLLLQSGADPDISDKKGYTPFMLAAQIGDTLMLSLLYKANVDIYKVNSYGTDALDIAMKYKKTMATSYLLSLGNLWLRTRDAKPEKDAISENGETKSTKILKDRKRISYDHISFNQTSISMGGTATNHLALLTGEVSLRDPNLKGGIFASYTFNPVSSKVLVESSDIYYQYRLKVKTIEAGIFKEFARWDNIRSATLTAYGSVSGAYKNYSEYNGTSTGPDSKFCIIPSLGLEYGLRRFSAVSEISYIKTPFYKMVPVWLSLKLSVNIFSENAVSYGKKINLYHSYEY